MDLSTEKKCLEEISSLIFDANEKITLKTISNNWMVHYDVASDVLSKWIVKNKRKEDLELNYLVRGYNKKGVAISVVSEEKRNALENKWKNFRSQLYSVDLRVNSRKLDLPDYEPIKVKRILLSPSEPRNLRILDIPVIKKEPAVTKAEPAKTKTPFTMVKPSEKKEAKIKEEKPKADVSLEKKFETIIIDDEPTKEVKPEKQSPENGKSSKGSMPKKAQPKNQKPVQKGSISSFFSNKPGTSKAVNEKPKEKPVKMEEEQKVEPRKRTLSPEAPPVKESKKKTATKKIKLKELPGNKRSRIRVIQDSSDEEEETAEPEEPESKFIKFDREFTPDEVRSPVKKEKSPEKKPQAGLNKHKSKRWVTKRFETEDGFIRTERVQEEYSASEDENDENKKKNSPPTKEKVPVERKSGDKKQPNAKSAPVNKAKQGSITRFFTRK